MVANTSKRTVDSYVGDRQHLSATERWPNKTTQVLDFTDPAAVRDALLMALGIWGLGFRV